MTDNVPPAPLPAPLRRLPWETAGGLPCYVPQGDGLVNELADTVEAEMIRSALDDGAGAVLLAEDPSATKEDLRHAVRLIAYGLDDVVRVAELRAERIPGKPTTGERARLLTEAMRASMRRTAS
ncbi:hypothetical protein ACGFX8_24660 [Streptomyces sp. NPDC048362]|uniref:hypothetical protein n=1 Tax=Streptomyces sp. NPDC048362 TaxID=3365539 RepID=UPI003722F01D